VKERASVTQSKTGKPVRFEITETTRQSLERWIADPEMLGLESLAQPSPPQPAFVDATVCAYLARLGYVDCA